MMPPNIIDAANSAPRWQFCDFPFSVDLFADGAALTGAVADLTLGGIERTSHVH
jgi:hypothetical protein